MSGYYLECKYKGKCFPYTTQKENGDKYTLGKKMKIKEKTL
jgi:hypothetical protein